jgi:hypothetical protein
MKEQEKLIQLVLKKLTTVLVRDEAEYQHFL